MEQKENLDLLISKMADPALINKLSLIYNKKQSFKLRHKANINYSEKNNKRPVFNETEECLKLLGFLGVESVTKSNHKQEAVNKNIKEFYTEDIKNSFDVTKNSCQIAEPVNRQGKKTKFSRKQRKSTKLPSIVTLSSDSSEDDIDREIIPSKIIKKKNSCERNKLLQFSNESVVFSNNKSKDKVKVENLHNSPKNKKAHEKRKEHLVIFKTRETYKNKRRNKKKSTKSLIEPHSAVFGKQDVITISSDNSTDSDADLFTKKNLNTPRKKLSVQKTERKKLKRRAKFVLVKESANISEANKGNKVSLLNPPNLSKSDPNRTCGEIPPGKKKTISDQNKQVNVVNGLEKCIVNNRNRAQDARERKTTENKAVIPTKRREILDHMDNLSNVLCNSNVVLYDSDTSDEEVLFQEVYKSVNSNACIEGHKSSQNKATVRKGKPFIKQANDLRNPEIAHKLCNVSCVDENASSCSLFASADSCIKNGKFQSNCCSIDVTEIHGSITNFGKEMATEGIPSKQSEACELIKMKIDFEPEPVNFEIPPLHAKERVRNPSEEDLARWAKQGVKITKGRWTHNEEEILRKNFAEFSKEYGISDPCVIFGINSDHKTDASILKFLRAKHFYVRLGKNLNDRILVRIYEKARSMFHPYASNTKWTAEEISKLMHLYKMFGVNWNKIGQALQKTGKHCHRAFKHFIQNSKYRSML